MPVAMFQRPPTTTDTQPASNDGRERREAGRRWGGGDKEV